jgi:hypothetical protein
VVHVQTKKRPEKIEDKHFSRMNRSDSELEQASGLVALMLKLAPASAAAVLATE